MVRRNRIQRPGIFGTGVLVIMLFSLSAFIAGTTAADELHWTTGQNEPEKHWTPKPEVLQGAYLSSQDSVDTRANVRKAISLCNDYIRTHADDREGVVDAYVIIAEAYSNLGEYGRTRQERVDAYEQGKAASEKVLELAPGRWDGWYWWAASAGRIAQLKGIVESLIMFEPIKQHILRAYRLAPHSPLVLDGLGFFYSEVPWFAGGSLKKSETFLKKALDIDPHFTLARLHLARVLLKKHHKAQARRELEILLHEKDPAWEAHYKLWDRPRAEELLHEMQ